MVFIALAIELSILLLAISLLVGVLQRHIPRAHIQSLLGGQRARVFYRSRVGGDHPVLLMLDPIVIGVLLITFGWPLTAIYVSAALIVALLAGWTLHAFRFERFLRPDVMLSSLHHHPLRGSSHRQRGWGWGCARFDHWSRRDQFA